MLYELKIIDTELSYDDYSEEFFIGIFESEEEARRIAKHYLSEVKGFCEFPCTYKILPKDVYGKSCNQMKYG